MYYIKKIIVLVLLVGSTLGALYTINIIPSEEPTVEKILPRQLISQLKPLIDSKTSSQEILMALITGNESVPEINIIQSYHTQLENLNEIKWVWSAFKRPILDYDGTSNLNVKLEKSGYLGDTTLNKLFIPSSHSTLILAGFNKELNTLSQAQAFSKKIAHINTKFDPNHYRISTIATPIIRTASWSQAQNDLRTIWPYLLITISIVPALFFYSLTALIFPLILASMTLTITLFLHQIVSGPINPLMFILIPFLWSIATLDGLHVYHRIARYRKLTLDDAIIKSKKELYLPCLITSITTVAGLIVLYLHGDSEITESVGIWGAVGTMIAYLLTFSLGGFILKTFFRTSPLPKWSSSFVYKIGYYSINHWKIIVIAWTFATIALIGFIYQVEVKHDYPDAFSKDHKVTLGLNQFYKDTNMDLAYFELNLTTTNVSGVQPFLQSILVLNKFLTKLPETKIVVSPLLFIAELFESKEFEKYPANEVVTNLQTYFQTRSSSSDNKDFTNWLDFENGKFKFYLFFKPTSNTQIEEMHERIKNFNRTALKDFKIEYSGPGYLYHVAQFYSTRSVISGVLTTLVIFVLLFIFLFKNALKVLISCVVFMLPPILVLGVMGVAQIPWSIGLISIPIILMSLGVDDTVHVMWPFRNSKSTALKGMAVVSRQSGLPLLTTTVLLCLSFLCLIQSGFQINHEIGILLCIGLALALFANLTLLPALMCVCKNRIN